MKSHVVTKEPTARSLVLELLSVLGEDGPHGLPVASLLRAGQLFGLEGGAIRVALSRLRARGLVEAPRRGHYRLAPAGQAVAAHVERWREVPARVRPWDGGWIAVATGGLPRADRAAQRTRERALSLLGFRALRPGLEVRPDNLDQGAAELAARLEELGLDAGVPVLRAEGLGVAEEEAATLWDAAELDGRCAALLEAVEALEAEMPALSWEAGACESFRVGGAVLRHFAFDPLLPAPIVDVALRHALVEAMARLDAIGRECWREALHEEREEDAA